MPNLINLNVVYDSSGLLTGLNDIDLVCSTSTDNKKISSSIYDISVDPPLKVPNQIDQNTKILTKIEDCNGSYYLVSDPYGKISDAQESNCEFCQTEPSPGGPEVDPVFSASPAHNITDGDITFLGQKDYNSLNNLPDLSLKADLVSGKVPASQLPSYVDDVIEGANLSALNALPDSQKETGKLYVALDTNKVYRWSGSTFVDMTQSPNLTTLGGVLPTIKIIDYTQDATNYMLRVSYTYGQAAPSGNPQFEVVIHSAYLIANNITTTQDSINQSTYSTNNGIGINGFITTILIPKANNPAPAWNNDIIGIMVRLLSVDNGDGGSASSKIVRRVATDMNLIGTIKKQPNVVVRYGTDYSKEWNGSLTTASSTAIFNISAAAFTTITNVTVGTELVGATIDNAPIGVITARSLTSITVSLYESKNTAVLVGGSVDGLENHAVANTVVYLSVKGI